MIDDGYGWTIITFFSSLRSCSDDGALSNCVHRVYVCVCVSANRKDNNEQHDEKKKKRKKARGAREVENICLGDRKSVV